MLGFDDPQGVWVIHKIQENEEMLILSQANNKTILKQDNEKEGYASDNFDQNIHNYWK